MRTNSRMRPKRSELYKKINGHGYSKIFSFIDHQRIPLKQQNDVIPNSQRKQMPLTNLKHRVDQDFSKEQGMVLDNSSHF